MTTFGNHHPSPSPTVPERFSSTPNFTTIGSISPNAWFTTHQPNLDRVNLTDSINEAQMPGSMTYSVTSSWRGSDILISNKTLNYISSGGLNISEGFYPISDMLTMSSPPPDEDEYSQFFYNDTEWSTSNYLNDTNSTTFDPGESTMLNYWALLLIVFPLFTVFGNVLVILSVKRERSLQNVTNYFIVSLAVADLLVAIGVMPFGVYFLVNRMEWGLPQIFCDFYIAMDVTCSTSSICNLVAISIDRFIAVTQPIKYAKHKSNTRVWLTIVFVWVFSGLVGSPIVLGLNTPDTTEPICTFHNKYFVLFSSLCSFYIPCAILVCLYYRIFKVIRERAKKAMGGGKKSVSAGVGKVSTVIENVAQTKKLAETTLGSGPSSILCIPGKSNNVDDEKFTNTGSGSQEDGGDLENMDADGDFEDASPDSDECQIIPNNQAASAFILESVRDIERGSVVRIAKENGNHDSGYAASNMEESPVPVQDPLQLTPKHSLLHPDPCRRNNGVSESPLEGEISEGLSGEAGGSTKKSESRFTICKVHKASRKKREKSSAKRERKATKTLAIVLGLFLACWLPFFTCNIMDALCSLLAKEDCSPGLTPFLLTTWLGYVNSSFNPVIYTIFNMDFRKAFKKLLGLGA